MINGMPSYIMSSFDMLNIVMILYEQISLLDWVELIEIMQNKISDNLLSPLILQQLQYNLYNAREVF